MPPSLGVPKPVTDLKAVRKGSNVTLTWTTPTESTDGELLRKPGKMIVLRAIGLRPFQPVTQVTLPPALAERHPSTATATDSLSSVLLSAPTESFVSYSVSSQTQSGRVDGSSNKVEIPTVPTLPPPQSLRATLSPDGVSLSWQGSSLPQASTELQNQYIYRVMRRLEGSREPVTVGQVTPAPGSLSYIDKTVTWENTYQYWITPVTIWAGQGRTGEVEGDDSSPLSVFVHDTFPPAIPAGLQAVYSGIAQHPAIDLTWTPNTETDLAGYNVYRINTRGEAQKLNSVLVKTPAFHDLNVQPGNKYVYAVSAVDLRGNESGRSESTSETVLNPQ